MNDGAIEANDHKRRKPRYRVALCFIFSICLSNLIAFSLPVSDYCYSFAFSMVNSLYPKPDPPKQLVEPEEPSCTENTRECFEKITRWADESSRVWRQMAQLEAEYQTSIARRKIRIYELAPNLAQFIFTSANTVFVCLTMLIGVLVLFPDFRRRRDGLTRCGKCDYVLHGICQGIRCPECGSEI